jgi:hypothetical protein
MNSARNKSGTQIRKRAPRQPEYSRQLLQLAAVDPAMLAIFGFDAVPIGS